VKQRKSEDKRVGYKTRKTEMKREQKERKKENTDKLGTIRTA
jgi:hypothetical protein